MRITHHGEQACPRRGENALSSRLPLPDTWDRGRWAATREEAEAEVAEFMAENPTGSIGEVLWPGPHPQPRSCSYCGGIHPDDAVTLVRAGWESEDTTKSYKRYLQPPGYRAYMNRLLDAGYDVAHVEKGTSSPVPPVKLYTMHFAREQVKEFNAALDLQKESP
jgi:hypothetical protein